jgi:hypothetical protein
MRTNFTFHLQNFTGKQKFFNQFFDPNSAKSNLKSKSINHFMIIINQVCFIKHLKKIIQIIILDLRFMIAILE